MSQPLLLDEMFSDDIAQQLRLKGYDVNSVVADPALAGLPDDQVLAYATAEGRALVTTNIKDSVPLDGRYRAAGQSHPGLILVSTKTFPQNRGFPTAITTALVTLLSGTAKMQRGQVLFLTREGLSMTERTMPEGLSDERGLLDGWLDYYRATLLAKCDGLTGQQLITRSCEPSPLSLIGLVRHMTEMERVYGHRLADWDINWLYCTDENEEGDIEAVTAAGAAADLETFRAHCAQTRQIMAAHQLDDTFGQTNSYTLRWFYLYLIKEYARHLGHADLLRERIDGATGE